MAKHLKVPEATIKRLSIYMRVLKDLERKGVEVISSAELADICGVNAAQIRKDLSHFGEFGKQGTGYKIEYLVEQLRRILKVDREWDVVLVGVGDLGRALAHYNGFRNRGFVIGLIVDSDPAKIGTQVGSLPVLDIAELEAQVRARNIRVAMVAVPLVDKTTTALEGFSLRLTIPVQSTGTAVRAVPISALSLAADGTSRVKVDNNGSLKFITVVPGLSADGYVEVRPVNATLTPGQMVVVGYEKQP